MSGAAVGHWPGPRHLALLHAGLDEADSAVAAWRRWRDLVDFGDVDEAEQALLPLAHLKLGEAIRDDPAFGRAAGLYRLAWTQNQLLFNRVAGALGALREVGFETLLLKGAPLSVLHYPSAGARPMADVDVLVRPFEAERAMGVLRAAAWRSAAEPAEAQIRVHHGCPFRDGDGGEVDLHWFSLWQSSSDGPLWEAARPIDLAGVAALAPCPADLLLLVCAGGSPRRPEPAFRWIADAVTVCRTSTPDWDRFVAEAKRRNLRVAAAAALEFIRDEFGLTVPDDVPERLDPAGAPRWERAAFRVQSAPASPSRTLRLLHERHRRMRMLGAEAPWHPRFPAFAASFWGLERPGQLPLYGARRVAARLAPGHRRVGPVR
jgi:hypothetical protein